LALGGRYAALLSGASVADEPASAGV